MNHFPTCWIKQCQLWADFFIILHLQSMWVNVKPWLKEKSRAMTRIWRLWHLKDVFGSKPVVVVCRWFTFHTCTSFLLVSFFSYFEPNLIQFYCTNYRFIGQTANWVKGSYGIKKQRKWQKLIRYCTILRSGNNFNNDWQACLWEQVPLPLFIK